MQWSPEYAFNHPTATIRYQASDMILIPDKHEAYPVLPESHGCIECYYYFLNHIIDYCKGTPIQTTPF